MVVESGQAMGLAACEALRAAGFEAVLRLSATEAFITCQERRPDLLITEYCLPEESGLELLKKLHRLENAPPALMVSALGNEEVAARAMSLGALNYQLKTADYLNSLPALARETLEFWRIERRNREQNLKQKRVESQNELAGWMAHNFRNILAASIGYLNLIDFKNSDQDNDRRQHYLLDSIQAQQSAIDLLEKIDRLTASSDFTDVQAVNVGEVVAEAWEAAQNKVLADLQALRPEQADYFRVRQNQVVFFNSARRLGMVEMVRSDLAAAMEALLCNALEAVAQVEDPRILVLAENNGGYLDLTVRDNGRGMDEEVQRHAAEALFSTKGEVGVGLGLSLVNTIAARYGGELDFKSIPDTGTSVKLSLKVAWC